MRKFKIKNQQESIRKYIDAQTINYNGDVVLHYRDDNGKKHRETIEHYAHTDWYFYITHKDYNILNENGTVEMFEEEESGKLEGPVRFEAEDKQWVKVFVKNENKNERYEKNKLDDRIKLKKIFNNSGVKIYEGDLKPHKRYCIDNNIEVANNFHIGYYDIETDDSTPGFMPGRDRILSIAVIDQNNKKYYITNEDEETILIEFIELVKKNFDILVGWNSDNFDDVVIEARLEEHMLEDELRYFKYRVTHIDFMQVFMKRFMDDNKITSWSLDFISNYFLGRGKIKFEGKIHELYANNPKLLKKYNIEDSQLLSDLNDETGVMDQILLECQICGTFPSRTRGVSQSELLDNYILRAAKGKGVHFPSIEYGMQVIRCPTCNNSHSLNHGDLKELTSFKCNRCNNIFDPSKAGEEIEGAYVMDPTTGLHDNVYVFDYKSLYPSIILTWNIGPDSYIGDDEYEGIDYNEKWDETIMSANNQYFWNTEDSIIKIVVRRLLTERKKYKKKMLACEYKSPQYKVFYARQNALKILCNSVYGIMGFTQSRYYRKEIAEAITLGGQWLNKKTKKWLEDRGHEVIYGDTDSTFVKFGEEENIPEMLEEIHEYYRIELKEHFNIVESHIVLEYEKKYKKLLLIKKKNYAGHITWMEGEKCDELQVKGLEYIKRNTIPLGKKYQKELLDHLLYEDHDLQYYKEWTEKLQDTIFNQKLNVEDITITTKLTKNPSSYKSKTLPVHVRLALEMREREMEYYVGMRVPYIVIADSPLVAVHPDWYDGNHSLEYYWDRKIYQICKRLLEVVYPNFNWERYTTKTIKKQGKKVEMYKKWLTDSKKQSDNAKMRTIAKIKACEIITQRQRSELLGKKIKKRFKIKKSDENGIYTG